jgi:hypothetical protein
MVILCWLLLIAIKCTGMVCQPSSFVNPRVNPRQGENYFEIFIGLGNIGCTLNLLIPQDRP